MRRWKRLFYYLMINVIVSACTVLVVLSIWDRAIPRILGQVAPAAGLETGEAYPSPPAASLLPVSGQDTPEPSIGIGGENPTEAATAPPEEQTIEYTVEAGDTLGDIANQFGVSIDDIIAENELINPDKLEVGQILVISRRVERIPTKESLPTQELGEPTATPEPTATQEAGEAQIVIDSIVGAGDLDSERVMLKRQGPGSLSMVGWELREEGGKSFVFPDLTLFQGSEVAVYSRAGQQTVTSLYWDLGAPVWQSGETAVLVDDQGVERATYQVP
jgi:LysM repeat protein